MNPDAVRYSGHMTIAHEPRSDGDVDWVNGSTYELRSGTTYPIELLHTPCGAAILHAPVTGTLTDFMTACVTAIADHECADPVNTKRAIHAGHVGLVTVYCDQCGTEYRADLTGATVAVRVEAARLHLSTTDGRSIGEIDLCTNCNKETP